MEDLFSSRFFALLIWRNGIAKVNALAQVDRADRGGKQTVRRHSRNVAPSISFPFRMHMRPIFFHRLENPLRGTLRKREGPSAGSVRTY